MEATVSLPGTGVEMPRVGFGVYQLRGDACTAGCLAALDAGYRHIDTAQLYGNEADVGRALTQHRIGRDGVFITTKIGRYEGSVEETYRSAVRGVHRITGQGHVDLFLIHRPVARRREMWLALERLLAEGKTRAVGVSNFRVEHLEEMRGFAGVWPPAVNQIELHPWCQQKKLVEYCRRHGIVVQAYSPLARGRGVSAREVVGVAGRVNRRRAGGAGVDEGGAAPVTAAQVLVRWSLQKGFAPLVKSGDPARIRENADVFGFELDREEMAVLDGLDMGAEGALFPANVSR